MKNNRLVSPANKVCDAINALIRDNMLHCAPVRCRREYANSGYGIRYLVFDDKSGDAPLISVLETETGVRRVEEFHYGQWVDELVKFAYFDQDFGMDSSDEKFLPYDEFVKHVKGQAS